MSHTETENKIREIDELYGKIESVYKGEMQRVFSLNKKVNNNLSQIRSLEGKIRTILVDLIVSMTKGNRLCVGEELTIRDENIFIYNKSQGASLSKLLSSKYLKKTVINNSIDNISTEDFSVVFDKIAYLYNMYKDSDYYSVGNPDYIPEDFRDGRSYSEGPYHIIYAPKKSSKTRIKYFYGRYDSKKEAIVEEANGYSGIGSRNTSSISETRINQKDDDISDLWHKDCLENLVSSSLEKIRSVVQMLEEIIDEIKRKFSKIIAVSKI